MGWITMGRDHAHGGLLSGGFLQEGEGKPEEEVVQLEQRKDDVMMWTTVMDTVETGWSFLQGKGLGPQKGFRWLDQAPFLKTGISESISLEYWRL